MHRGFAVRGGANEYKINEVLGAKLIQFDSLLASGIKRFTFGEWEKSGASTFASTTTGTTGPTAADPQDLHYDFSEYVIAATAALKRIENPDIGKAEVAGQYADVVSTMYRELISGKATGAFALPTDAFAPVFPYRHEDPNTKFLVPGFHLFSIDKTTYPQAEFKLPQNALVNAIRYLYHFIALLDTQNLNAGNVITLLRQDKFGFMKYVDSIADLLLSKGQLGVETAFPTPPTAESRALLVEGVLRGLTAVATRIITQLNNATVPVGLAATYTTFPAIGDLATNGGANKTLFGNWFNTNFKVKQTAAEALFTVLEDANMNDISKATADPTGIDPKRITQYVYDSLYNPGYLNFAVFKETLTNDEMAKANEKIDVKLLGGDRDRQREREKYRYRYNQVGGPTGAFPAVAGGNEKPSLLYLYGPKEVTANVYNLTTKAGHGDKVAAAILPAAKPAHVIAIMDKIVALGDEPSFNYIKVASLALVNYLITKNKKISEVNTDAMKNEIRDLMGRYLDDYRKIAGHLQAIPNDYASLQDLENAFVNEFTLGTYKGFMKNTGTGTGKVAPRPADKQLGDVDKKNITADPEVKDFVLNVLKKAQEPALTVYSKYFNLIRTKTVGTNPASGDVPLRELASLSEADLANYRLNVRKQTGYNVLLGGQRGGAWGDIVFIANLPEYNATDVKAIWITRNIKITPDVIAGDREAIRNLGRVVWNTPQGETVVFPWPNARLTQQEIWDIATRVGSQGLFQINYNEYFKAILKNVVAETTPGLQTSWKENEQRFSEHMLRQRSMWERRGNEFVRLDDKGNEVPGSNTADNNCAFINEATRDCVEFFTSCLSSDDKNLSQACARLMDFTFQVNPGMEDLKNSIMNLNPFVAYGILKRFKFGSYLHEEEREPLRGFRRYKVQSVGSWLAEISAGTDRCRGNVNVAPVDDCNDTRPLAQQLGEFAKKILEYAANSNKHAFFDYLDALVQWVNANPQVLNPEEIKNPSIRGNYPKINDSFRTYDYRNPYRPAEVRLRSVTCGLERLKSSIMNELSGANAPSMISAVASVPLGIEMPLARPGFMSPVPLASSISMLGGGIYDTETELKNINYQYGHTMFEQIYNDLISTMKSMTANNKNIKLTYTTEAKIQSKLDRFRQIEDELRKSLIGLIERNKLYQASRGYINPYDVPYDTNDAKFAAVLSKHSNLLNLSAAYNKKAINLIDLFQTIAKAILGKMDDSGKSASGYERPMTADYHSLYTPKKN